MPLPGSEEHALRNPPEGWTPPVLYDVRLDAFRVVTQADVDAYMRLGYRYGALKRALEAALEASKPVDG